jgi:hypothetical protein
MHHGIVEGFVDELGGCSVTAFHTIADGDACQVDLILDERPELAEGSRS